MATRHPLHFISVIFALVGGIVTSPGAAAQGLGTIRDAEIENTIRTYALPLLNAASLDPEAVRFHIVRSPMLNAFVAGGQRMFLTTGMLRRDPDPGEIIGVMAHEIGHIAGSHLARLRSSIREASNAALIAQLVGIAVGVLARDPAAAVALGSGGAHVAERSLLKFNRTQEQSADQAAIKLLDRTGQSSRGLLNFLRYMSQQEMLTVNRQDRYLLTHPLTRDRLLFVENHVTRSPNSARPVPADIQRMQQRMIAKLDGFIDPPATTLAKYKADDPSVKARYARAVALYRIPDLVNALAAIDGLIAEYPRDPYFHELKGQMLFENGRLEAALPKYEMAVRLAPNAPLLRVGLAHVQVELNRPALLSAALGHLKHALRTDHANAHAWRLSATAYGRLGRLGMSALSQAEYSLQTGRRADAHGQARKAARLLKRGSPAWLRAEDISTQTRRKN